MFRSLTANNPGRLKRHNPQVVVNYVWPREEDGRLR
jgi:hypothetical protein